MSKIGAVAMLTVASLSGSANAQADLANCVQLSNSDTSDNRCFGPLAEQNRVCCPGLVCMQKNEFFGACRLENTPPPLNWTGTIITAPVTVAAVDMGEDVDDMGEDVDDMGDDMDEYDDDMGEDVDDMGEDADDMGEDMGEDVDDMGEDVDDMGEDADDMGEDVDDMGEDIDDMGEDVDDMGEDDDDDMGEDVDDMEDPVVPAGAVAYTTFEGLDYLPTPVKSVSVQDLPEGAAQSALDIADCQNICTSTPGCNAASFYIGADVPAGSNCWLKTIGAVCELPTDSEVNPSAVFLLQIQPACATADMDDMGEDDMEEEDDLMVGTGPELGLTDDGLSGQASDDTTTGVTTTPPTDTTTRATTTPTTTTTTTTDAPNSAVSVRGAMIAMAVAGAAAFL